jgi:hypothetical protein
MAKAKSPPYRAAQGGCRTFTLAPSQREIEVDAIQKSCIPAIPASRSAFDITVLLGRCGFGAYPILERLPLSDQALMADVEDDVGGQRPIQRRHQQAAARRAEWIGDGSNFVERFAGDCDSL